VSKATVARDSRDTAEHVLRRRRVRKGLKEAWSARGRFFVYISATCCILHSEWSFGCSWSEELCRISTRLELRCWTGQHGGAVKCKIDLIPTAN